MTFEIRSDFAVVGYNAEDADMDRPRGEQIRERFYMLAVEADGSTRTWGWFATLEALELAFEFIAPPVDEWQPSRPIYASLAYERDGWDRHDAASELVADLNRYDRFDRVYA